jgi:lysozyme family protein
MAQLNQALDFILDNEDRHRSYEPAMDNNNYPVIAGINRKSWTSEYDAIAKLPVAKRPSAVEDFYNANFWQPMKLQELNSQDVANRVMDMGVNAGYGTAIRLLQRALLVKQDGLMGPTTISVANATASALLLSEYRKTRVEYYLGCKGSPQLHAAWEARAKK